MNRVALRVLKSREFMVLCVLVCLSAVLTSLSDQFLTGKNLSSVLIQVSGTAICAVGMTAVILTGGIDVSVGAIVGIVCAVIGKVVLLGHGPTAAVTAGVLAGVCYGLVNGFLVGFARVPPIIVTLGTMNVGRAIMFWILGGRWIYSIPPSIRSLGMSSWLGIPIPMWIALVLTVGAGWFLASRPTGRFIYAIGGSRENAMLSGIPVGRVEAGVYLLNAVIASLAALTYLGRTGLVQTNTGIGFEMDAIAAVVLGGVSTSGGKGTVWGSIIGALLVGVIKNGLILVNVPALLEGVVIGVLIVGAVMVDCINTRGRALWARR